MHFRVSRWCLGLSTDIREFDYDTVGDFVVSILQYALAEVGARLRKAADESLRIVARSM